ncbi:MAG: hypothetical protein GY810_22285 [Aureispira sp.]|nr:hypothetical protein [Aureispira sp.]
MNRLLLGLLIALTFGMFWTSCDREIEEYPDVEYAYFPLETGKYITYQVDSVNYDEFNCTVDTTSIQLKEEITTTDVDGEGNTYYRTERYYRNSSNDEWQFSNVWVSQVVDYQAHRVEDNQRYIKLVFPVVDQKQWDGIIYIRRDTLVAVKGGAIDFYKDWDEFKYTSVDEQEIINGKVYEEVLTVEQVDKINNIERRYSIEKYAKGIGLISKEMWILDTQCRNNCKGTGNLATCINTPWEYKAERGFILKQTILSHN